LSTDDRYEAAYKTLQSEYPKVMFVAQDSFKEDLISIVGTYKYVFFIVDDNIFTGGFSLSEIKKCVERDNVVGFSFRLGKNTNYCYSLDTKQKVPNMNIFHSEGIKDIMSYEWPNAMADFGYALELSSSLYKMDDLYGVLRNSHYPEPNSLEWSLYLSAWKFVHRPLLLCYEESVAFCNPINKVQSVNRNRAGEDESYSPENLLKMYETGYRIPLDRFDGFTSNSCHVEARFLE
jgi:hypothetical protein